MSRPPLTSQYHRDELNQTPCANSTLAPELPNDVNGLPLPAESQDYRCPDETQSISWSVHLARLASFYPKCRLCSHRHETGCLSATLVDHLVTAHQRIERSSLLATDGVRAVYLNELDRTKASVWGAALAAVLWDEIEDQSDGIGVHPTSLPTDDDLDHDQPDHSVATRRGPLVVIGYDERTSSPDIVTGVALGLKRMGCRVIDLGQSTAPCFQFSIRHLDASAGLFVTGANCDPAWTGFDIVGRDGQPWSQGGRLDQLELQANGPVSRRQHTVGSQRPFQALVPYEAGLWKYFHAMRPLHVVIGTSVRQSARSIDRLFARLPCRVTHVSLPVRHRDVTQPKDVDIQRVGTAVVSGGGHLGLVIDEDGQRCAVLTDRGRLVSMETVVRLLIGYEQREDRSASFVLSEPLVSGAASSGGASSELKSWLVDNHFSFHVAPESAESLTTSLIKSGATLAASSDGRYWFRESAPVCDAIITLARLLQILSLSDIPLSELVQNSIGDNSKLF